MVRIGVKMVRIGVNMVRIGVKMVPIGVEMVRNGVEMVRIGVEMVRIGVKMVRIGVEMARNGVKIAPRSHQRWVCTSVKKQRYYIAMSPLRCLVEASAARAGVRGVDFRFAAEKKPYAVSVA